MRMKVTPEDFVVEELLAPPLQEHGPYAVYRVKKRNLTTLELQAEMAHRLGLPSSYVDFPALKDKVAVAIQHATVKFKNQPPPKHLKGRGFEAELLGFRTRPLCPKDLKGNKFQITLRDIAREEAEPVLCRFHEISSDGFPNYFDLQRFGSWSARLGFPGKLLLQQRWEEVLQAYLAEPLAGDPPAMLRFKKIAHAHWGDWKLLKEEAPRGNLRSVLAFLSDHPKDHKRAANLIAPRILSLWLSAYQSFLWNNAASCILEELARGRQSFSHFSFPWGRVAVPRYPLDSVLQKRFSALYLPLPSTKNLSSLGVSPEALSSPSLSEAEEGGGEKGLIAWAFSRGLVEEGLSPQDLKARGLKRAYLPRGERALWARPLDAEAGEPEPDELFPGRLKLVLSLALPPGTYATLFLRLLAKPGGPAQDDWR